MECQRHFKGRAGPLLAKTEGPQIIPDGLGARWRHVAYICKGGGGGEGGREGGGGGRTGEGRIMEFDRGREGVRGHAAITEQDALKPVSGTDGCWDRSGVPPFSPLCILHFLITTSSPLPPSN